MKPPYGGDPGGSLGPRYPSFMDPQNEFGRLTILLMTGKDGAALPADPVLIGMSIESVVGDKAIESAKSEDRGARYILRIRNQAHVTKLLNTTTLLDGTEITIIPHPRLNTSKCVIFSFDAMRYSEAEALEKLRSQNVSHVKRITRNDNGNVINTPILILTFNQTTYPSHVKIGLLYVETRPFYPNPLLCYACFQYGHPKLRCRGPIRCNNCSDEHDGENCQAPAYCCNCQGGHRPGNRKCPVYQKESAIVKLKVDANLSYPEARRRIEEGHGSYAQVASQSRLDVTKFEELMAESKRKDETISKLLEDNKKKDEMILKLFEELKAKSTQMESLERKVDALQSELTTSLKSSQTECFEENAEGLQSQHTPPTDKQANAAALPSPVSQYGPRPQPKPGIKTTTHVEGIVKRKNKKEERHPNQLKDAYRASSEGPGSPPKKTMKPAATNLELEAMIEYIEEDDGEIVDITDGEPISPRDKAFAQVLQDTNASKSNRINQHI